MMHLLRFLGVFFVLFLLLELLGFDMPGIPAGFAGNYRNLGQEAQSPWETARIVGIENGSPVYSGFPGQRPSRGKFIAVPLLVLVLVGLLFAGFGSRSRAEARAAEKKEATSSVSPDEYQIMRDLRDGIGRMEKRVENLEVILGDRGRERN